jgi:hypothetical protein
MRTSFFTLKLKNLKRNLKEIDRENRKSRKICQRILKELLKNFQRIIKELKLRKI